MDQSKKSIMKYKSIVKYYSPNSKLGSDVVKAFIGGGLICTIGQLINNILLINNMSHDEASMYTSIILIFLGVLLTCLGIYDKIGKFCGAGSVVPITGFANSVAAPALEFKKEGYVLGVTAKIFVIAGPVIIFGLISSVIVGFLYYYIGR